MKQMNAKMVGGKEESAKHESGESPKVEATEPSDDAPKKNWIAGAIGKPGALHAQMNVPPYKTIPADKLAAAAKRKGVLGKRARLAQTLAKFKAN